MNSVLLFDTEVLFSEGKFPQATKYDDCINRIYCVFFIGEKEVYYVLTTFQAPKISTDLDINYLVYSNELELIFGFGNLIKSLKPDIITGYNISQFDFNYIHDRLLYHGNIKYSEKKLKMINILFVDAYDYTALP